VFGGNYFVREDPLCAGLPVDTVFNWEYQALAHYGLDRYALRLEGEECIVGAQIDHRKELFTAVARIPVGKGQVVFSTLDLQGAIDEGKRPAVVARRILRTFSSTERGSSVGEKKHTGVAGNDVSIWDRVERCGVIAVLVIDDADHARPLADALLAGGVDAMELTLRTDAALGALKIIRREVPDMLAGIGTILTPEQVEQVVEADGAFGVAPGCNPRVVRRAQELGLPFAPGIATASDIEAAVALGCRQLKFFPAEPTGGMKYLKSVMAPYAHLGLTYVPLGGLNAQNMTNYLSHPAVPAVGGSWIAKRDLIQGADWAAITERAAEARRIIDELRKQ